MQIGRTYGVEKLVWDGTDRLISAGADGACRMWAISRTNSAPTIWFRVEVAAFEQSVQPVTAQFFTLEGRPYRAIPTSRLSVVVQFSDRSRLGSSPRLRLYFTVLRARAPLCPLHVAW